MREPTGVITHRINPLRHAGYVSVVSFAGRPRQVYVTVGGVNLHVARRLNDIAQTMSLLLYRGWTIGAIVQPGEYNHPEFGEDSALVNAVLDALEAWFATGMPEDGTP